VKTVYHPYIPSRQDPGFLERTATGRDKLLSTLLAGIEQKSRQPKHQLLIGPRGIGKSHIIALLHHKIKNSSRLMAKWLPVSFPEEAAGIITLRDFMEKVTRLSGEELENEGLSDDAMRLREILEVTDEESSNQKAINQIRSFLIEWTEKNQRKILILLENADRVIGDRITKRLSDERWLADLLMNEDIFYLIATSAAFFKQTTDKDHPLCGLFQVDVIDELSLEESTELLIKYAAEEGRTALAKKLKTRTNRAQAIYTLAGGNPRLLIMLYVLIRNSDANITNVEAGFFSLLEDLTPYFQSCMAQLTAQEEKVLVAFAEGPEFLGPEEVGRNIHMSTDEVTAHLQRLKSTGFVKEIEKLIKEDEWALYRLSATSFRYWYQMNSEQNREMSEIFIRFLILYYTYSEIEQIYLSRSTKLLEGKNASTVGTNARRELRYLEVAMRLAKKEEIQTLLTSLERGLNKKGPSEGIKHIYEDLLKSIRNILRF
jgi:DNA-binding MarR family transcriptional regulator/energy-coupling factor transporter ATP-binding protein EcfA2